MCTVCGCNKGGAVLGNEVHGAAPGLAHDHGHDLGQDPAHTHDHGLEHAHGHVHGHEHAHEHALEHAHEHRPANHAPAHPHAIVPGAVNAGRIDFGGGIAGVHVAGLAPERVVQIEMDILSKNNAYAADNRRRLAVAGVFALNLVSSPGSGKTTLLVRSIEALRERLGVAVIEGDQQTSNDAQRIRAAGAPAVQINTGKGCHLDAHMVAHAMERFELSCGSVLFIENVGNLVCPAAFDLGEAHKVAILSVTEGDDKPLKYPDMFRAASLMILSKVDLLPHVDFNIEACVAAARQVNPGIEVLALSARTGEGVQHWLEWVQAGASAAANADPTRVARSGPPARTEPI